jgi:RNA polymerase subunit RPABC4/transcription elongation factor Spt4
MLRGLFFNLGPSTRKINDVNCNCNSCDNRNLKVLRFDNRFSILSIPLIKWGKTLYLYCGKCKTLYEMDSYNDEPYYDIKLATKRRSHQYCESCNKVVSTSSMFCPICYEDFYEDI